MLFTCSLRRRSLCFKALSLRHGCRPIALGNEFDASRPPKEITFACMMGNLNHGAYILSKRLLDHCHQNLPCRYHSVRAGNAISRGLRPRGYSKLGNKGVCIPCSHQRPHSPTLVMTGAKFVTLVMNEMNALGLSSSEPYSVPFQLAFVCSIFECQE